jgi:hypothetical protein
LVYRVDERQKTVAAINVPVAMALGDSRRAQRRIEELVSLVPELGLHGIRAAGGAFDI